MRHKLRIFTWHVHGSYLYYLSHVPHDFYIPVRKNRESGYCGRTSSYPWPDNVIEVPEDQVPGLPLDCILFQSRQNYEKDQYLTLSPRQRNLPSVYLEHDPPRESPTDTRHPVQSPATLLVHVTAFNQLMWDPGPTPTRVVDHGVAIPPGVVWNGHLNRGVTVINNLRGRGRRLGSDLWDRARREVDLDLFGMASEEAGGQGELPHAELPARLADYRFFLNPIRYTSLGLAVLEAMAVGLPIVGLATTEMVTAVPTGVAGFLETDFSRLIPHMRALLADPALASRLGEGARTVVRERFSIERFVRDWEQVFNDITKI